MIRRGRIGLMPVDQSVSALEMLLYSVTLTTFDTFLFADDNTPRQSLNLQFTLRMHIAGLIGEKGTSVQLSGVECPFILQPE